MELIEVNKIWDKAEHNAFTDLIKFKGEWYCSFREGSNHVCNIGTIRVIKSKDTKNWESVASIEWENGDLRDPKLSITSDNKLMLNACIRYIEQIEKKVRQSITWFSSNGQEWSNAYLCSSGKNVWRWSVSWNDNKAYSFAHSDEAIFGRLYSSKDGKAWELEKDEVFPEKGSFGNESSLVFLENDDAYCLLRRDKKSCTAMLGFSKPPYKTWEWKDLGRRIGGPKMVHISEDRFLAGVRLNDKELRTSLCWVDAKEGTITEALRLPSGGDTSYCGFVLEDKILWVSYYSSHEGKTAIYLAKVKL